MERTEYLISEIVSCTEQWEKYEHLSTICSFIFVGMICFILIIATFTLILVRKEGVEKSNRKMINGFISAIVLIIPVLCVFYLYVFSMNTRKVAIYQGYIGYLEQELNAVENEKDMLYCSELIDHFMSGNASSENGGYPFYTNRYGPVVMILFLVIILPLAFVLSWKLYRVSVINVGIWKVVYTVIFLLFVLIFIVCSAMYVNDLILNDEARRAVFEFCMRQG